MQNLKKKCFFALFVIFLASGFFYKDTITRLYQGIKDYRISKERAKYYLLQKGIQIEDITKKLISDENIPNNLKLPLINGERHIVIFKYPSGSEYVAGYLSYITQGNHPVMIFLRGGNGFFGIMRPNNKFSFLKGYNVVGTLYRGNIYGGKDDLGGKDIDDVENLIRFFPTLENFSHIKMKTPYAIMGVSRGAMEMFLSLSKSNYVKSNVTHAISISGNVDLKISRENRPEMDYLFKTKFKKSKEKSFSEWLKIRNPVDHAKDLPLSLKVLLIYGLSDNRVSLQEQKSFKKSLDHADIKSTLVTIPGANHGLEDHYDEVEKIIIDFLKS